MLALVLTLAIGFGAGYGIRELISRKRRAAAREQFLRRRQLKHLENVEESAASNFSL